MEQSPTIYDRAMRSLVVASLRDDLRDALAGWERALSGNKAAQARLHNIRAETAAWTLAQLGEAVELPASIHAARADRERMVEITGFGIVERRGALRYGRWTIYRADGLSAGFVYVHDDFDGAPDAGDNRCGYAPTVEQAKAEIDDIEIGAIQATGAAA